jgi:hypothetical protein
VKRLRRTLGHRIARQRIASPAGALAGAILAAAVLAAGASPAVFAAAGQGAQAATKRALALTGSRHAKARKRRPAPRRPLPLKMIWGPVTLPDGSSAFPVYHSLGVQVLQLQLIWARTATSRPGDPTNPSDPSYRWPAELEQAVSQAAQYGISLAILVKGTPGWANGGRDETWAPNDPADFAAFLQAASRRYPSVHYWMIWGEPQGRNFNPMPPNSPVGPRRYAVLLDAAYGALKAVDPANVVIGGMTWTAGVVYPAKFLHWMRLPNGSPPRLDYYGHNPYGYRFPNLAEGPIPLLTSAQEFAQLRANRRSRRRPTLSDPGLRDLNDIDTLHSELAAVYRHRRGGTPKLWLSEYSVSTDRPTNAFSFFVSRPQQARWLTAAFKLVDSSSYVAGLGWFELLDQPPSEPFALTEGLLTASGTPKPSLRAFQLAP